VISINQHNYEEFFLLYVDGELSAADMHTVEQFAQANPGFADELDMLLQTRLTEEPVLFDDKISLFRNESAEISLTNYEERFLLYVDNELDTVSKEKVETFVLQHPALQDPFTQLKQTRLEPETIVFPKKESLYRKEEKEKPVFYLYWQRIAVAAALIGVAVLTWTLFPGNNATNAVTQPVAKLEPVNTTVTQKNTTAVASQNNNNPLALQKNSREDVVAANQTVARQLPIDGNMNTTKNTRVEKKEIIQNKQDDLLTQNITNAQPVESKRTNTVSGEAENTHLGQYLPANNNTLANTEMVKVNNTNEVSPSDHLVQQTVYKELDTDDEKKSLYLGSIEINKDKLRGFFRKASSLLRGKAKQEEEERTTSPLDTRSLK